MMEKFQVFILFMEEILHQLIGSLSRYFQGFMHSQVVCQISEPSTVCLMNFLQKRRQNTWNFWATGLLHRSHKESEQKTLAGAMASKGETVVSVKVVLD